MRTASLENLSTWSHLGVGADPHFQAFWANWAALALMHCNCQVHPASTQTLPGHARDACKAFLLDGSGATI